MVLTICSLRTFLLLSLLPPKSLGHGSRRAAKPPPSLLGNGSELRETYPGERKCTARIYPGERKCTARNYPGERKCSTEIILGNGRRLRQKYPGERKTTATRLRRSCRAKSRPPTACCALPRPSLISIHITLSSAARTVGE